MLTICTSFVARFAYHLAVKLPLVSNDSGCMGQGAVALAFCFTEDTISGVCGACNPLPVVYRYNYPAQATIKLVQVRGLSAHHSSRGGGLIYVCGHRFRQTLGHD